MFKLTQILILLATAIVFSTSTPIISTHLIKTLQTKDTVNIFVVMSNKNDQILSSLQKMSYKSRGEKLTYVANTLKKHTSESQKEILSILARFHGIKYESLWINNQIYISGANLELLNQLSKMDGISNIHEDRTIPLVQFTPSSVEYNNKQQEPKFAEAGVDKIQAPLVWSMPNGTTGQGIIVGEMTTGVRRTHEAIRDNFVGDYGWYDPESGTSIPYDESGIGTYSTGLLVGNGGIGVAFGAKWMACKGCRAVGCEMSHLLRCGQFMACPTNPSGGSPDCTKAPHVVVNNWGGGGSAWYEEIINLWHTIGITPVFVGGINGPECETVGAGDNVIAVGSVALNDTITPGSSRGPSQLGKIRPDIVGPGVGIRSAFNTNDTAYTLISSTTPASCLVSGTVALLKAKNPNLTYEQIVQLLIAGADTNNLTPSGGNCGGINENIIPNNAYGYGRVNAFKSIIALQNSKFM